MDLLTVETPIGVHLMRVEQDRLVYQLILVGGFLGAGQDFQMHPRALGAGLETIRMLFVGFLQAEGAFVLGVARLAADFAFTPSRGGTLLPFDDIRRGRLGTVRRILTGFSQFLLRLIPLRLRLAQLALQGVQSLAHLQQKMLQRIHFGAQRGTTRTRGIGGYRLHAGVIGPSTRKLNRNPVNGNNNSRAIMGTSNIVDQLIWLPATGNAMRNKSVANDKRKYLIKNSL